MDDNPVRILRHRYDKRGADGYRIELRARLIVARHGNRQPCGILVGGGRKLYPCY